MCIDDCRNKALIRSNYSANISKKLLDKILPRVGTWRHSRLCPVWEGKLLMKTSAIGMFFVHYITLRESADYHWDAYDLPRHLGAVLHYKEASTYMGNIYGAELPLEKMPFNKYDCRRNRQDVDLQSSLKQLNKFTLPLVPYLEYLYERRIK
jgi:hypothetical protein